MTRLGVFASTLIAALGLVAGASSAVPAEPQIVFATGSDIYVRDADGSVTQLTKTRWSEGAPSWDSSGRKNDFRLRAIGADGKSPRVLGAGTEADW